MTNAARLSTNVSNTFPSELSDDISPSTKALIMSGLNELSPLHATSYFSSSSQQSKITKIFRICFAILIITTAILAGIYWHQTVNIAHLTLEWQGRHPYIGAIIFIISLTILTTFLIPHLS